MTPHPGAAAPPMRREIGETGAWSRVTVAVRDQAEQQLMGAPLLRIFHPLPGTQGQTGRRILTGLGAHSNSLIDLPQAAHLSNALARRSP